MASKAFTTGSLKELWRVTYPLMISALSTFLMITVDRYFLGIYSKDAMNASTAAGTFVWAIILTWTTMAMMAEIFVAQFNGAKKFDKLGTPVWQMIWFSLLSFAFFIPFGIWGNGLVYSAETQPMQVEYTRWMMFAGPPFVVLNAVSAFFIGQGKTTIIKWMAILGNLVNVLLDPLLIFGYKDIIPPMGIPGACIATGIGAIVQVVVLWKVFLNKKNRAEHGTGNWRFNLTLFKGCLRVGLPPSLSVGLEVMGWAAFYKMMSECGQIHIDSATISQTILMLFLFFGFALEKGCATVAGNLIGAGLISKMKTLMKSGMTLLFSYSVLLVVFLVIFPDILIDIFTQHHLSGAAGEVPLVELGIMAKVK
ncbi:MAG: MATE family efflux transporter, partial [Simkaniaceae bacterium]|nr:MATE family efflux transporter [Simkaniaceae bacterium]